MIRCTKYNKANTGKVYNFTILKEITLPYNSLIYYVIVDDKNCKFTIPKNNYQHYNFKIGQSIKCSLDKINCSGQIFFEPLNPYYKEGSTYNFEFIEFKTIINYLGFTEQICIVKDVFGKLQHIRNVQNIKPLNNSIKAIVWYIKKGKLFLLHDSAYHKILIPGNTIDFKIVGEDNNERFGSVYVLVDKNKNKHVIPIEFYNHYQLKKQEWFKAIVKKLSSRGFFYIEPLHPIYTIGKTYTFKTLHSPTINNLNNVLVKDCFNNIIAVDNIINGFEPNSELFCEVIDLKKGKPILRLATIP